MASTQGEIRVGPSHQARLPDYRSGLSSTEVAISSPDPDLNHVREDLRWIPAMTLDTDLLMYLRAARSMAAFAGMCDGGSPDDGCIAASRDDTTINALDMLHDAGYDPAKALQALVKCPVPKGIDKKWSEEETKRFVKGLRQFGKNFFRIRKDLLPHKDTSELVEFYYLWKKTPGANNNRPHRRNRRQGSLRRIRNTRNTRGGNNQAKEIDASSPVSTSAGSTASSRPSPNSKDQAEGSSGSEEENSEDENSDSRDNSSLRCQHCFSTNSRDWQQSGKDRSPLCSECRAYSKKYGELPPLINNPNVVNSVLTPGRGDAPYLFRPVQNLENSEDFSGRMRTRTRSKEQTAGNRPQHGNGTDTPESEMDKKLSKSPASNACSPSDKNKKKSKSETPTKGRKRGQMDVENEDEKDIALFKRRRNDRAESPAESLTTDSGSMVDDGDTNEQDNESSENAAGCVVGSATESSGNNVFQSELSLPIDKVESVGSSVTSSLITNVPLSSSSNLHQPQFTTPPPPPPPLVQNLQSSVQIALSSQLLSRPSLPPPSGSLPLHPVNAGVVPSGVVGSVPNSNVCSTVSSPAAVSSIIGSSGSNCDSMSISGENGNLVATGTVANSSILNATINTTLTSNTAVNISNGATATSAAMNSYPCGTGTVPTPTTSAISNISPAQSNSKFSANIPLCFPAGSAASAFSSSLIPSAATVVSSGGSIPTSTVDVDSPTNGVNVSESALPTAGPSSIANTASVITTTVPNAAVSTITTIAPSVTGTTSGYLTAVSDTNVHGSAGRSSCSSPSVIGLSSSSPSIAPSIIANTTTCTTTTTTTSVASTVGSLTISPNSTSGDLSSSTIIITAALTSTSTSSVSSTCASARTSLIPSVMAETISNTLCTSATDNVGGVDPLATNSAISATSGSILCAFESSDTCPPNTTYVTPAANTDTMSSISLLNPNIPLAPAPVKLGPAMTPQLPYVPGDMVLGVRSAPLSLKTQGSECSHEPHVRCGQGTPCVNSSGIEGIRVADIAVIDKMNKDVVSSDDMKIGFDRDIVKLSNTISFSHCAVKHEGLKLEKLEKEGEFHCSSEDNFYKARREARINKTEFDKKDQSIISCFKGVEDISTGMNRNPHIKEEMDSSNDGMMNVSLSGNLPLKDSISPVSLCPSVMSAPFSNSSAGGKSGSSNVMSKNFQKVTPSIKLEPGLGCEEQIQHSNRAEESGDHNDLPNLPSTMSRVTSSASESSSIVDVSSSLAVRNPSPGQGTSNSTIIRQTVSDDLSLSSSLDKESYPPGNYEDDGHDKLSHLQNPLSSSDPGSQHNVSQGNPNQTSVVSQGFNFLHAASYHSPQRFGSSNEENVKKILTSSSMPVGSAEINQNEPQNLKIKQEVISQSDQVSSDPLQSLKEVKIPGYSGSNLSLAGNNVNVSQGVSGFGVDIQRSPSGPEQLPFLGPSVENIKKEPDSFVANSDLSVAPPVVPASALKTSAKLQSNITDSGNSGMPSLRSSPLARAIPEAPLPTPISSSHMSVPHSAVSLISPSRLTPTSLPSAPSGIPNPVLHPAQQSSPLGRSSPGHPHPTPHPHPSPHPHSSPFIGPPSSHPVLHHHPHTLIHHSLFAAAAQAAAVHHNPYHPPHPYAAYGYPFPYHYGHLPQHHPLPPHHSPPASVVAAVSAASALPQRSTHEPVKVERPPIECPTSLNSSSSTSHSSSSRREILTNDDILPYTNQPSERHHAQEIVSPFGHHQSHLSLHSIHAEKPGHSTSQPSSLPLQPSISAAASTSHKGNTPGKCVSAANRSSPTCHNAPIMSTVPPTSTSVTLAPNNLQHSHGHHHQLLHHSPSIPGGTGGGCTDTSTTANALLNHSAHNVSSNPRAHHPNPGHHSSLSYHAKHNNHPVLMVQPPALNHQGIGLGLTPSVPASSLEALRAHAQAAANVQQQQQQQQLQMQQQQIQCNPSLQSTGLQLAIMHSSPHSPLSVPGSHQLPSRHLSQGFSDDMKIEPSPEVTETQPEEEIPSPSHVPRGPSPEPKIEDTECHRSQSAIFLRHWNRGDFNSCARTDLTFKPVPDSKLARKREERLRKQAEREREEREKAASQSHSHKLAAAEKAEASKPPSRGPIETITSPYDRFTPRQGYDTPALRQLSEYARPHAGFSPGTLPRSTTLGLTAQCIDPLLHYQLNSMYGPGARERLELEQIEREKRERDIRELRERELNDRLKDELIKSAGTGPRMASSLDAHCLDLQRRYAGLGPGGPAHQFGLYTSPAAPSQTALNQLERERLERLGIPTGPAGPLGPAAVGPSGPHSAHAHPHAAAHASSVAAAQAAQAQLEAAERLALATDPMVRLQMAGISPEYHAHTHAHTHAHSHTHLHLHPGQQAAQAQAAQQAAAQQEAAAAAAAAAAGAGSPAFPLAASAGAAYPRPSLIPGREPSLTLHHPPELLGRGPGYADQLAHQLSAQAAHEQLQRQIMLERERFPHPHASLVAQHEEYLRTFILTFLRIHLPTYLPTYLLTYLPTYLLTYVH